MFIAIIILSITLQAIISLFVLQKNPRSMPNILFFLLNIAVTVWAVLNFIITNDPFSSSQLLLYRALMASVIVQNTLFFIFAHTYPNQVLGVPLRRLVPYSLLSIAAVSVAVSPLLFLRVVYGSAGARPVAGPGMLLFITHAAISVVSGLRILYKRYRASIGITRLQSRLILMSSVVLWGVVPITNFGVSLATKTLFFARISPIYTLVFSSIIAYAMVRHRFFDIRAAVARSVAYVLSLGTISLFYGVIISVISRAIFATSFAIGSVQQVSYVVFAVFIAATFQPIKVFFDKLTERIFYQDAYDSQTVLTQINTILTTQTSLEVIMHQCQKIICDSLKISHATFIVLEGNKFYRTSTLGKSTAQSISIDDLSELGHSLSIADTNESKHKKRIFRQYDIGASLCLKTREGGVGYIFLGPKRSGSVYTSQDVQILEIIENELAIAVKNARSFEEIQKFNETLQQKITDATRELRKTNEKLKALDEAKDEFISMASHQLRTPLTSVKGYVSMVLEGDAGKISGQQKQLLEQAFTSSQRMVYLIADLLNVSRLRTGKFVIEAKPTYLPDVIEGELQQLTNTAKAHNLTLIFNKPATFPTLNLDETKTRQVIMNFMDNAIYYTPSGGHINVELTANEKTVEYKVIDDGLGVPKEEQHHLFTKFFRAANARKARPDGTGLGLYMAKKVIVAQGGSLIFSSTEGKGSVFGFTFPLSEQKLL